MIYPAFLRPGDTVGITAPSAGIDAEDFEAFDLSLDRIRPMGVSVIETPNVRAGGVVSGTPAERAAQMNALLRNDAVSMIWCACGGDFLVSMLPYIDWAAAVAHPKWVQGYSDPTSFLYALTTTCDIATLYGGNAGSMDGDTLLPYQQMNLDLLRGKLSEQHSFAQYQTRDGEVRPVFWETPNGAVNLRGRLLGGCMECLLDIMGTRFDGTHAFAERYKDDGILWYFDVFALKAEQVHNALWHMKECGWLDHARGVVLGRVMFPDSFCGMSYRDAAVEALGRELPLVLEADVGHVPPRMTLINGALATLAVADGQAMLTMELA